MNGVFNDREAEQVAPKNETELTLGSFTLLLIFFVLVLVCGLCFGLGYSMGHRGPQSSSAAADLSSGSLSASQADSTRPKPSANASEAAQPPASVTEPADGSSTAAAATPPPASEPAPAPVAATPAPDTKSPQAAAKPASAKPAASAKPDRPTASGTDNPASAAGPIMVQVAAVSEQEDAEVLMGALRKRGYAVVSSREPLDGLIHVRIGPFKTRDEADTWRQKLLNDGYNAIMQP